MDPAAKNRHNRPVFAFLVAALFVVSLGFGILAPSLPDVAARAGISSGAALSLVYSTYSFAKISAQLPAGYLSDRVGGTRVLRFALVLYVIAMASMTLKLPIYAFIAARFAEGVAEGSVYPSVLKLIRESTAEDRIGKRIGLALGIGSSGILIGPVVGALLAKRGVVQVTGVASAMGCIVLTGETILSSLRKNAVVTPRGAASSTRDSLVALRSIVLSRRLLRIAIPVAFNKLMTSGFFAMFPLLVAYKFGGDKMTTAAFFLVCGLSFIFAQILGGNLADRYPLRKLLVVYAPLLVASTLALGFRTSVYVFGAILFIQTLLQTCILLACLRALATKNGTKNQFGGIFGALATATDLFTIPGPPLALLLFGMFKERAFWGLAAGGIVFYLLRALIRQEPPATPDEEVV